jgi:hypothetical protein
MKNVKSRTRRHTKTDVCESQLQKLDVVLKGYSKRSTVKYFINGSFSQIEFQHSPINVCPAKVVEYSTVMNTFASEVTQALLVNIKVLYRG